MKRRITLREAFIRGYRAGKRRLNEATFDSSLDRVVRSSLKRILKSYKDQESRLLDEIFEGEFKNILKSDATFIKEIKRLSSEMVLGMEVKNLLWIIDDAVEETIKGYFTNEEDNEEYEEIYDLDWLDAVINLVGHAYQYVIGKLDNDKELLSIVGA